MQDGFRGRSAIIGAGCGQQKGVTRWMRATGLLKGGRGFTVFFTLVSATCWALVLATLFGL